MPLDLVGGAVDGVDEDEVVGVVGWIEIEAAVEWDVVFSEWRGVVDGCDSSCGFVSHSDADHPDSSGGCVQFEGDIIVGGLEHFVARSDALQLIVDGIHVLLR